MPKRSSNKLVLLRNSSPVSAQCSAQSGENCAEDWKGISKNDLNGSEGWLSQKVAAQLESVPLRTFQERCKLGKFEKTRVVSGVRGAGGVRVEIHVDCLSELAIGRWLELTGLVEKKTPEDLAFRDEQFRERSNIANWQRDKALRRYALLKEFLRYAGDDRGSMTARKAEFCRMYNRRLLDWPDEFYTSVPKISPSTMDAWSKTIREVQDPYALAPQNGAKRGSTKVSDREAEILKRTSLLPNVPYSESIADAKRIMQMEGIVPQCSDDTYQRWIKNWRENNYHVWVYGREGAKALNDKCLPYLERDNTKIEAGDLLVADGHTFNFDILDPITGRPKRMTLVLVFDFYSSMPVGWEIAPTENTRAIAMAYYRAMLTIGYVPRAFYLDNGRAFRGKFFTKVKGFEKTELPGLFERLKPYGFKGTMFAKAYHGQTKPIERFFGVLEAFSRKQEMYRGRSIDEKVPRLMRNEKAQQDRHRRMTGGVCPTVADVHLRLMEWIREEYSERPLGEQAKFAGRTPRELYEESFARVSASADFSNRSVTPNDLRFMMMETTTAALYRNGIKMFGQHYWSEELFGFERGTKSFVVRYDLMDTSSVWVYDETGKELICEAKSDVWSGMHPMAKLSGSSEDVDRVTGALNLQRSVQHVAIHQAKEIFKAQEAQAAKALPPVKALKEAEKPEPLKAKKTGTDGGSNEPDYDAIRSRRLERLELERQQKEAQQRANSEHFHRARTNQRGR